MSSNKFSIAIAAIFLVGVAAWFGARIWTFGSVHPFSLLFRSVLAIALATCVVRGIVFYRWFMVVISAGLAYSSFGQYCYLNSKGIAGDAFILPGAVFSLCSAALFTSLLAGHTRKRRTKQ